MTDPKGAGDWRDRIRAVARDWLFSDVGEAGIPERVLLPFENPYLHNHAAFIAAFTDRCEHRCISIGTHRGRRIGILKSVLGAPAVAMTVDLLADFGVNTIVGVGFCGGLRTNLDSGDLLLPVACVREDGTGSQYVEPMYPAVADLAVLDGLRNALRATQCRWRTGLVWSTDAVLLETSARVAYWAARGVDGVDMECATLYTVARLRSMRSAAVLVASDNAAALRAADGDMLSSGLRSAIGAALESLATID